MIAGIVTLYAGPAISIAVQNPISIRPIGPAKIPIALVIPTFAAKLNPRPRILSLR